jgi:hypothetical protein
MTFLSRMWCALTASQILTLCVMDRNISIVYEFILWFFKIKKVNIRSKHISYVGYGNIVVIKFWYSGIWHCVMWQVGTDVLEEPAASIFRVKAFHPEIGGIWFLRNFITCQYHTRKYAVTILRNFDLMFTFRFSRSVYQWNQQCRLYDITLMWWQKQIMYISNVFHKCTASNVVMTCPLPQTFREIQISYDKQLNTSYHTSSWYVILLC